jgi:cytochrome c-type biogenesis protein CcmH
MTAYFFRRRGVGPFSTKGGGAFLPFIAFLLALYCLLPAGNAWSGIHVYDFPDPQTEQRFRELTHELRCPKCQNQNINDSDAPLARDIKDRVHSLLLEGKSNDEITDFMIERYGDFVTYRPRLSLGTFLLWTLPALLALLAFAALVLRAKKRQGIASDKLASRPGVPPAADEEPSLAAGIMKQGGPDGDKRIEHLLNKYNDGRDAG